MVFMLSESLVLYSSTNGGKEWDKETHKLDLPVGSTASSSRVVSMHPSPADPKVIFLLGKDSVHWITRDMGKTYQIAGNLLLTDMHMNPSNPALLLGSTMSPHCKVKEVQGICHKNLVHIPAQLDTVAL